MVTDEEQIRALIEAWGRASEAGDLDTQLALMTEDVTFLTTGNPPMSRADFITGFTKMMKLFRMVCHSDVQEITVTGDFAISWNHLTVEITPLAGGAVIKRSGDTLSVLRRGPDGQWRLWRDANLMGAS